MTTRITISQVLRVPTGEIAFTYPRDPRPSQNDKKYESLRVERRGLRRWNSFQENPACLQAYLDRYCAYPEGWRPYVTAWQRYAASERMVQDVYGLTLIHRVNVALDAAVPRQQLSIIGTPKHFPSWGTETSRAEGGRETKIAPDWVLVYGDSTDPPLLAEIDEKIIAWGDTKLTKSSSIGDRGALPDTVSCREAHLAQVVQYCIDFDIPFGFVLTNHELIVFHLVKNDGGLEWQTVMRTSHMSSSPEWQHLPSDATEEPDFSSPLQRATGDWIAFDEGDDAIPLLICEENRLTSPLGQTSTPGRGRDERLGPAPPQVSRPLSCPAGEPRHTTPEPPASSQQSSLHPDSSPCPPDARGRRNRTPTSSPGFSPSEPPTVSQQGFSPDFRGEDPTHVLMKAYPAGGEGVAQRLFELCMLAKAAKDNGALSIGPRKLSFASAL